MAMIGSCWHAEKEEPESRATLDDACLFPGSDVAASTVEQLVALKVSAEPTFSRETSDPPSSQRTGPSSTLGRLSGDSLESGFMQLEPSEEPPTLSGPRHKDWLSPGAKARAQTRASQLAAGRAKETNPAPSEGLRITLALPGGHERTVVVKMRPLGMVFQKVPPFRVNSVEPEGHVKDLGIQVGWEVKRVGMVDLRWLTLIEAEADLAAARRAIAALPVRIPMVVQAPGGHRETVILTASPVGMEFNPMPPFDVTHVTPHSHAERLGVRKECLVKRVGSVELRERADVRQALAQFELLPSGSSSSVPSGSSMISIR